MLRRRRQFARPQISALESRQLLTAVPNPYINSNGFLVVVGTNGNDSCKLIDTTRSHVASVKVVLDGYTNYFEKSKITGGIHFIGLSGNDNCADSVINVKFLANGGDGNDTLTGSNGDDDIRGENGDDLIYGNAGGDSLRGGDGNDTIIAGDGADFVMGESGNDRINGGNDPDNLFGNDGNDVVYGGAGNDLCEGDDGDDFLDGEADGATYYGGRGLDCIANQPVIGGVGYDDISQAGSSSCWFLATLGAMTTLGKTNNGQNVDSYLSYQGNGVYNVKLYNAKSKKWVTESVKFEGVASTNSSDARVMSRGDTSAKTQDCEGEFWATVIHRGMLQYYKIDYTNASAVANANYGYGAGKGGFPETALKLLGNTTATHVNQSAFNLYSLESLLYRSGILQPMIAGSVSSPNAKVVPAHAYQIIAIGTSTVTVRNPWGTDGGTGGDGVDDGIVTLTNTEFISSFGSVSYTSSPVV